jgi:Bacterial archaeo-eukaryotic release factor family 10
MNDRSAEKSTDMTAKVRTLARTKPGPVPVISVYLDTRWSDEHQRERVRVFLKNQARQAAAMAVGQLDAELAWIGREGERLVAQEIDPETAGTAMFIGGVGGLREVLRLAVPFPDTFVVAEMPQLRPLVTALGEAPRAALLFVDGESARLVALTEQGAADEVALEATDAVGHHRRGGWLLLLQSRYQRHIHVHRARHFDAVAHALAGLIDHYGLRAIVLAGEARNLAVFRTHLPSVLDGCIVGEVSGARYEPTSALAERALAVLRHGAVGHVTGTLDALLAEAAGGGRATAGIDATLEAVNRCTVDRLYLLGSYQGTGAACLTCHALQRTVSNKCCWCGAVTRTVDLAEAMVQRVLAAAGNVASVDVHAGLGRAGGVAALLRYANH